MIFRPTMLISGTLTGSRRGAQGSGEGRLAGAPGELFKFTYIHNFATVPSCEGWHQWINRVAEKPDCAVGEEEMRSPGVDAPKMEHCTGIV